MFGALADFERNLIRERTQAGLAAARARGRQGGRPEALDQRKQHLEHLEMCHDSASVTCPLAAFQRLGWIGVNGE